MASKVTPETLAEYRSGTPLKEILDRYGISKTQFYRRLAKEKVDLRGPRERFSDKEWAEIIEKYCDGVFMSQLADQYQSTIATLSTGLKERGIHVRDAAESATVYNEQQIQLALDNYVNGATASAAGAFCEASEATVLRWLRERGEPARQQPNYGGNHDFFKTLDTEQACYWFGFLCADGNLVGKRYLRVLLSSKDVSHLELFQQHLGYTKPIKIYKKIREWADRPHKEYEFARSLVGSVRIVRYLKRHGMLKIKAGDWRPLEKLNDKQFRHFLRGYFDGDGSIGLARTSWKWYICGLHKRLLNYMGKRMSCVRTVNIHQTGRKSKCWRLAYAGNRIVPRICRWLHKGATIKLNRKDVSR